MEKKYKCTDHQRHVSEFDGRRWSFTSNRVVSGCAAARNRLHCSFIRWLSYPQEHHHRLFLVDYAVAPTTELMSMHRIYWKSSFSGE